jgi:acetyltransferase-like isoleucine patch superfamily enzyme
MAQREPPNERVDAAVHGLRDLTPDPPTELALADQLREKLTRAELLERYSRHAAIDSVDDATMRRVLLRALCRSCGHGVSVGLGVQLVHPETFEIGDGVFLGNGAFLQGRHDGRLVIGARCWIGPQSYFDGRDAVLEEYVGWGPGAKLLGAQHTGEPPGEPIIRTPLRTRPVRVCRGADIGVNAVLLPGVTVGAGAIVGAAALVSKDVAAYDVVAGVPARVIGSRRADHGRAT